MEQHKNAEQKEQEREQIIELGSDITNGKNGKIYTLTIIGQVEGCLMSLPISTFQQSPARIP